MSVSKVEPLILSPLYKEMDHEDTTRPTHSDVELPMHQCLALENPQSATPVELVIMSNQRYLADQNREMIQKLQTLLDKSQKAEAAAGGTAPTVAAGTIHDAKDFGLCNDTEDVRKAYDFLRMGKTYDILSGIYKTWSLGVIEILGEHWAQQSIKESTYFFQYLVDTIQQMENDEQDKERRQELQEVLANIRVLTGYRKACLYLQLNFKRRVDLWDDAMRQDYDPNYYPF